MDILRDCNIQNLWLSDWNEPRS